VRCGEPVAGAVIAAKAFPGSRHRGPLDHRRREGPFADQVNKLGRFDAVIHNAGIGYRAPRRMETEPGVPSISAVNVLAAYILTTMIDRPGRLVYVSSGTHHGVRPRMDDLLWAKRAWSGFSADAESKLCDVLLPFAVARRWKDVRSNALGAWLGADEAAAAKRDQTTKSGSHQTLRWREMDSNFRFRVRCKRGLRRKSPASAAFAVEYLRLPSVAIS